MQLFLIVSLCLIAVSQLCLGNPVPEPEPGNKRIKINVPYKVHKIHHHHIEKVPVIKKEVVYKEVPVVKHVEVVKHVPVEKLVPYPVEKIVPVEKKVYVPIHVKEEHQTLPDFSGWDLGNGGWGSSF